MMQTHADQGRLRKPLLGLLGAGGSPANTFVPFVQGAVARMRVEETSLRGRAVARLPFPRYLLILMQANRQAALTTAAGCRKELMTSTRIHSIPVGRNPPHSIYALVFGSVCLIVVE
jgi:hypothetical protein